jgi:hypothetical protein
VCRKYCAHRDAVIYLQSTLIASKTVNYIIIHNICFYSLGKNYISSSIDISPVYLTFFVLQNKNHNDTYYFEVESLRASNPSLSFLSQWIAILEVQFAVTVGSRSKENVEQSSSSSQIHLSWNSPLMVCNTNII